MAQGKCLFLYMNCRFLIILGLFLCKWPYPTGNMRVMM
jgi:hypothetical protein